VLDHRQVTERRDRDVPMSLKFFTEGGAAGQFLPTVDRHCARPADRGAAGIAERHTPVTLVLDANEGIEDGGPTCNLEAEVLRMGGGIDLGIESLDREGQAHRTRSAFRNQPSAS